MITRRIQLAAGIAAACLLGSGIALAKDEDPEAKNPLPVAQEDVDEIVEEAAEDGTVPPKESWISGMSTGHEPAPMEEEQPVSDTKVEAVRDAAENRDAKPKESWISGMSTGHEPAPMEEEEKDKDDE